MIYSIIFSVHKFKIFFNKHVFSFGSEGNRICKFWGFLC